MFFSLTEKITISAVSQIPVYEQIENQIREQVLSRKLESGTQLPSIRVLARELKVGVITVKRAYDDLCTEGILFSQAAKGIFVAELDYDFIKSRHLELIKEQLRDVKHYAQEVQIDKEDLIHILELIYKEEEK